MNSIKLVYIVFFISLVISCDDSENRMEIIENNTISLPSVFFNYSDIEIPTHLSTNELPGPAQSAALDNDNTPTSNLTTNAGATLGRVLFYDKKLSANGTVSCASCHKQDKGFSDDNTLSIGFEGGLTRRHSMSLINASWYDRGRFFWDERAETLEDQVLMPFQDEVEMGMTLQEVVDTVESQSFYLPLFEDAFGNSEINSDRISKALAQFVRSIISVESKYDTGRQLVSSPNDDFPNFTASENNGKQIFFRPIPQGGGSCVVCHTSEAFIGRANQPTNNGLDAISDTDFGVFEAIPMPNLVGTFKVPSLKNIALTAPYMHDGRFKTLEEVVEHYNSGIQNHPNLDTSLRTPQTGLPVQLNLSEQEKIDLVNFLKTLTDDSISDDEKFSDPFLK